MRCRIIWSSAKAAFDGHARRRTWKIVRTHATCGAFLPYEQYFFNMRSRPVVSEHKNSTVLDQPAIIRVRKDYLSWSA